MANLLIDSLTPTDAALLTSLLRPMKLDHGKILFDAGDVVENLYFPQSGIVSLVVSLSTGETVEAAMVGRDGVVGASSALDGKIAVTRAIVQLSGTALLCNADAFKAAVLKSPTLLAASSGTSRLFWPRPSNPRPASPPTSSSRGWRGGCCARAIWRKATCCRSRRNSWPTCWARGAPAFLPWLIRCSALA